MAALVVSMLILSMAAHSCATWCVCKRGADQRVLQEAIDYACGNGADCTQTHQGGKCFNPETVIDHCSYAVNSYFQKKGQAPGSCDFAGAAMATTSDPSSNGCTYPSSASGTTVSTLPNTNTVSPGSTSTSPYGNNPLTGGMAGLGPSGAGMDTDVSHGVVMVHQEINTFGFLAMVGVGLVIFTWV